MDRLIILLFALALTGCTEPGDPWYYVEPEAEDSVEPDAPVALPEIDPAVQQIFTDQGCTSCHGGGLALGGFSVESMAGLVAGGSQAGPSIVACDPDSSPLVQVLEGGIDDGTIFVSAMPKGGSAVPDETVQVVRDWIAAGAGLETCDGGGGGDVTLEPELSYEGDILPIFEGSSCMSCHGNGATSGGLDLSTTETLLTGGAKAGPSVIPCDPDASPLVMVVEGGWSSDGMDVGVMPPFGELLATEDIDTIRTWISTGAGQTSCGDGSAEDPTDPGDDPDDPGDDPDDPGDDPDDPGDDPDDPGDDPDDPGDDPDDPGDDPDDPGVEDDSTWATIIRPLLDTQCGACHTSSGYGTPKFLDDESTLDNAANHPSCDGQTVAECIYTRMADGTMPLGLSCASDPTNEGCPTEAELQQVKDWVDAGAPH